MLTGKAPIGRDICISTLLLHISPSSLFKRGILIRVGFENNKPDVYTDISGIAVSYVLGLVGMKNNGSPLVNVSGRVDF
jgi:hypothetical protein